MKKILILVFCIFFVTACRRNSNSETEVKQVIEKYFESFNTNSFDANAEITTEDWYHINPFGGWNKGRSDTLKLIRDVHLTFLKDVK